MVRSSFFWCSQTSIIPSNEQTLGCSGVLGVRACLLKKEQADLTPAWNPARFVRLEDGFGRTRSCGIYGTLRHITLHHVALYIYKAPNDDYFLGATATAKATATEAATATATATATTTTPTHTNTSAAPHRRAPWKDAPGRLSGVSL